MWQIVQGFVQGAGFSQIQDRESQTPKMMCETR